MTLLFALATSSFNLATSSFACATSSNSPQAVAQVGQAPLRTVARHHDTA